MSNPIRRGYNKLPYKTKKLIGRGVYFFRGRISRAQVIVSKRRSYSRNYLERIKGAYEGERCFVLGNGPSLKVDDLNALKGEITFASNRIYKIFGKTDWRPTYYAMMDEAVAQSDGVMDGINRFQCKKKFFLEQGYYAFKKAKGENCWLHAWYERKYLKNPQFSEDLTKGVYCIATVTYMMLQIAVYMGFKDIYLLGVDNSYGVERNPDGTLKMNKGQKNYFGEQGKEESNVIGASWESDLAFAYAEKYSREHGFRIYNATRGGALQAFERVNLDDILLDRQKSDNCVEFYKYKGGLK